MSLDDNPNIVDFSPIAWLPKLYHDSQTLAVRIEDVPEDTQRTAFDITITFNEDVDNFISQDITLTGDATATVTALTVSPDLINNRWEKYTATITPQTDGDINIQVPAAVAQYFDKDNVASPEHTVSVDVPPTVVISNVPTDTQSEAFNITITFSENVTGFEAADISLTGDATATLTTLTGSGAVYTATITPATDGDVILQVPAGVAADTGSNTNTASDPHTVSVDVPPTVVISDVPTDTQSEAFNITITFSENVTGF